jgi:hypothetical protein
MFRSYFYVLFALIFNSFAFGEYGYFGGIDPNSTAGCLLAASALENGSYKVKSKSKSDSKKGSLRDPEERIDEALSMIKRHTRKGGQAVTLELSVTKPHDKEYLMIQNKLWDAKIPVEENRDKSKPRFDIVLTESMRDAFKKIAANPAVASIRNIKAIPNEKISPTIDTLKRMRGDESANVRFSVHAPNENYEKVKKELKKIGAKFEEAAGPDINIDVKVTPKNLNDLIDLAYSSKIEALNILPTKSNKSSAKREFREIESALKKDEKIVLRVHPESPSGSPEWSHAIKAFKRAGIKFHPVKYMAAHVPYEVTAKDLPQLRQLLSLPGIGGVTIHKYVPPPKQEQRRGRPAGNSPSVSLEVSTGSLLQESAD